MKASLRYLVPLVIFLVLAGFLFVGLFRDPREVPSPLIGKPAPDFALATLQDAGRTVARKDLAGKVWLLNVWASWCGACREEHPVLIEQAGRLGVPLLGLDYKDTRPEGLKWLEQRGNPYALTLFDADGRVGLDFGVYGVPETYLVDAAGTIRYKHIGPLTPDIVRDEIQPLLKALHG